jgi:simple sugar transport system substrate-binding protein
MLKVALALVTLLFASCFHREAVKNGDKGKQHDLILGFSQIGAENAWRNCNTRSVREAAQAAGIQLLFENAEQKQENQIKAIRSFIAYRVDVIAFVPIVADGWDNVLREAQSAGIPVLVTDRKITTEDPSLYAGFIGTDSEQEGREAGHFMLKKFAGAKRKGPVRIAELAGTEGASVTLGRAKGFREILAGNPDFQIVYSESGDFLRSRGYEITLNMLDKVPRVDAVFSHNDSMMLGMLDAFRERGIKPGKDVVIVSIDAEQAAIDALKAGEVNFVIECNPKTGPAIMELAKKLAAGEKIPRLLHVDERVFSEDEKDLDELAPRGY